MSKCEIWESFRYLNNIIMPVLFLLQLVLRGSNGPLAPERLRGTRGVITAFCGQVNDDCVTWNTEGLNEYENRNQTCKTSAYRHNFFLLFNNRLQRSDCEPYSK